MGCSNTNTSNDHKSNHNQSNPQHKNNESKNNGPVTNDNIEQFKELKINGLFPELAKRWSPRAFSDKSVEPEKLHLLFQAASWCANCYNVQPWNFLVGSKGTSQECYDNIFSTLTVPNQAWAKLAPTLIIICVSSTNDKGIPVNICEYDCGQAMAFFTVQAGYLGLYVHQMSGFSPEKVREFAELPEDIIPLTAIAVGYLGKIEDLPDAYQEYEKAPRTRKEISEIQFNIQK